MNPPPIPILHFYGNSRHDIDQSLQAAYVLGQQQAARDIVTLINCHCEPRLYLQADIITRIKDMFQIN
jgi:hypothetical protein